MRIDSLRVRALRRARHWSQDQLADACGLNLRTVQRLESSGRASLDSLRALAAVFEVEVDSLSVDCGSAMAPSGAVAAIRSGLQRFDDFSGRSGRPDYWWFMLAVILVLAMGALLHPVVHGLIALALIVPMLAAGTRRLRDAGESPWWQLFWLVPFGLVLVVWLQTRPTALAPASRPGG
ncbi:DUF805 domain-containing protein [Wenzhouxiangella sp. XN79A]|uniref:DUF805 domain-containing protein n=1 Tax=Wenzhouxiangella sp. XN79A TaxID=2724193 RepID=UPI00144AEB1C|nr:DUF805 domain-containing protein [Wenzhouxiangella sp. XN79A]NKI36133.1 DUF805 domain-containing protein [Wenzhouxiangella sp. XN79A]